MQESRLPDGSFTERRIRIDEEALRRRLDREILYAEGHGLTDERVTRVAERPPYLRTRREREAVR